VGRGSLCGSSGIMSCRYLPFARLLAAHLPRIAAPSTRGASVSTSTSIEAACSTTWPELGSAGHGISGDYPLFVKQFMA
jgi:hypothetical protein